MPKVYEKFLTLKGKETDRRSRRYLVPRRVVMTQGSVKDASCLLAEKSNQITLAPDSSEAVYASALAPGQAHLETACVMRNTPDTPHAAVLLDFGREIAGSARIMVWDVRSEKGSSARVLIRFGESVMEALTPIGVKNATNDHAPRDIEREIVKLSAAETNETGYRFVYIELLDDIAEVEIKAVQGVFTFLDLDYIGNFECDNDRINRIWNTAAYTAHLCMQEHIWDGIKRDRLVWAGDLYTEMKSIMAVFGHDDIMERSLDLLRDRTPIGEWMNGISSYSIWWLLAHHELYRHFGNKTYLSEQRTYIRALLERLMSCIGENGEETLNGWRFLDWKNSDNPEAIHAGLQALLLIAFEKGAELMSVLEEDDMASKCHVSAEKLKLHTPSAADSKQAAALLALSGLADKKEMNELISLDGAKGFSTYFGYFLLSAMADAGNIDGALEVLSFYFGGMLDMGATTFWEDFDTEWTKNSARIDEIVPNGKNDIHGDFGAYCYENFRHSLCHGWASGACPWLSKYVLGIEVLSPRVIRVTPHLGKLRYAQGCYPTPYGVVKVAHTKRPDGSISTQIVAPSELKVLRASPDGKSGSSVGY